MLIITENVSINLWIINKKTLCYAVYEQSDKLERNKFYYNINGMHIVSKQTPYILKHEIGLWGCLKEADNLIDVLNFDTEIELLNFVGKLSKTLYELDKIIKGEN